MITDNRKTAQMYHCTKCGDSDVIIDNLCAECLNEREYERIDKESSNKHYGWNEDDWD